jgi:hypothetical protein
MPSYTIDYRTTIEVPAPYSYMVQIGVDLKKDILNIDFKMQYTNREELDEEEILNEGFSLNDDFEWAGIVDNVWADELENLLSRTDKRHIPTDEDIIITESERSFAPHNYKDWNFLLQDLIQAVFETSGKEKPWQMDLVVIKKENRNIQQMKVLFAKREIDFAFGSNIKMDWQRSKKFMEQIYLGEFDEAKASEKKPDREGVYISFDENMWYQLGKAITGPNGNKSYLNKLSFELEGLV